MKPPTRKRRGQMAVAAAIAALAGGRSARAQVPAYIFSDPALSGSEFLRSDGYQSSASRGLNALGDMVGTSSRFKQTTIDFGQAAWFFNPLSAQTFRVGLTDNEHTTFDGYQFSNILQLNDAGFVVGYSDRYNRSVTYRGRSLWSYDPTLNLTTKMGLIDAAHTRADGYRFGSLEQMNAVGQVLGSSDHYSGSGAVLDQSLWFYNPATATTTAVGLTDAIHTRNDGLQNNVGTLINTLGRVVGIADRYIGTGTYSGQTAWYYTPTAGMMTIGLSGTEFASSLNFRLNDVKGYDTAGNVVGTTARYNGGTTALGQAVWYFNVASLSTSRIGFTDSEHTASTGAQSSFYDLLTSSGDVIGHSTRYNVGSTALGQSTWFYNPALGTTSKIGLADTEHTSSTGAKFSAVFGSNGANQVVGYSTRYNQGAATLGVSSWFYDPNANTTVKIGLVDAEHTNPVGGFRYSFPNFYNDGGQVAGYAERYDSSGNYTGQSSWFYNAATNTTSMIGLFDTEHTDFFGDKQSTVQALTAAGQVLGTSDRYNQGLTYLGQSAWHYNPLTLATTKIGLVDAEHTSSAGFKYSTTDFGSSIKSINTLGQVVGYSSRFNQGSIALGQSTWFYNPTNLATTKIGLTDTEHTRADGYKSSQVVSFDDLGRVLGYSNRFNQTSGDLGQSAWSFNPTGAVTTKIGLFDSMHTRSDGYRYSTVDHENSAGQVLGYSTRYNQTANALGQSAWLYDPGGNSTSPLVFSAATDGRATTSISSFGNDGVILGDYEKFSSNTSLGLFGFYWSASSGFIDLGDHVGSGGLAAAGASRISGPIGIGPDGSIYGTTTALNAGGNIPWRLSTAPVSWTGGLTPDGTWSIPNDWSSSAVPQSQSAVVFNLASSYSVQFTTSAPARSANVVAGDVMWHMSGNSVTLTGQLRVGDSVLAPTASLCIDGGTVVAPGGVSVFAHATLRNWGTVQGNLTNSGSVVVSAGKSGREIGALTNTGVLTVAAGGAMRINGTLSNTGTIDLAGGDLIVDYTGASPLATIQSQVATGYNSGSWNGSGIRSSIAALSSPKTAVGYAEASTVLGAGGGIFHGQSVDGTSVLVKYTYAGDANLDGIVDIRDLRALAGSWHTAGSWVSGDFNYNGYVDASDLGLLSRNWQVGVGSPLAGGSLDAALLQLGLSTSDVPEPGGVLAGICTALATCLGRRRRNSI